MEKNISFLPWEVSWTGEKQKYETWSKENWILNRICNPKKISPQFGNLGPPQINQVFFPQLGKFLMDNSPCDHNQMRKLYIVKEHYSV